MGEIQKRFIQALRKSLTDFYTAMFSLFLFLKRDNGKLIDAFEIRNEYIKISYIYILLP